MEDWLTISLSVCLSLFLNYCVALSLPSMVQVCTWYGTPTRYLFLSHCIVLGSTLSLGLLWYELGMRHE